MVRKLTLDICAVLLAALVAGCGDMKWDWGLKRPAVEYSQTVPKPLDLLLPKAIRVHPFTGQTFDEADGAKGIDVRIEAIDAYGDATKAFGNFRFEMYHFVPNSIDPKGDRIATWDEPLLEAKDNLLHWDKISRMYIFKLQWDRAAPMGKRVVLVVSFESPFTKRLTDEREFVSGQ